MFALAAYLFDRNGLPWGWFWFVLVPDLAMLGYVINKRIGAISYNLAHNYALPALLIIIGFQQSSDILIGSGLIWLSHVGFDRALGYGLKLDKGFEYTHLGAIGRARHNNKKA